jgi:hypothetical protein
VILTEDTRLLLAFSVKPAAGPTCGSMNRRPLDRRWGSARLGRGQCLVMRRCTQLRGPVADAFYIGGDLG